MPRRYTGAVHGILTASEEPQELARRYDFGQFIGLLKVSDILGNDVARLCRYYTLVNAVVIFVAGNV
jgi:hypothetical protein